MITYGIAPKYYIYDLLVLYKRYTVVSLEIFLNMFLKKYKLYNLIKREIYILTTTIIKKYTNA